MDRIGDTTGKSKFKLLRAAFSSLWMPNDLFCVAALLSSSSCLGQASGDVEVEEIILRHVTSLVRLRTPSGSPGELRRRRGNIHLALGDRYNWTVVGKPALAPLSERRPISAAQLQLLFQLVTYPESTNWPVRRLETAAGISKSKAAQARTELVAEGLLAAKGKGYQLGPKNLLTERLASGYATSAASKTRCWQISIRRKDCGTVSESSSKKRSPGDQIRAHRRASRGSPATLLSRARRAAIYRTILPPGSAGTSASAR